METMIVGSAECQISEIVKVLEASPVFTLIEKRFPSIASSLGISKMESDQLWLSLRIGKLSLSDAITTVLEKWTHQEPTKSTLNELIIRLKLQQLNEFADRLESRFIKAHQKPSDSKETNVERFSKSIGHKFQLDFNDKNLENDVLPRFKAFMLSNSNPDINTRVILQIATLDILDHRELSELLQGNFPGETVRMLHLFRIIETSTVDEVKECLQELSNFKDLPRWSAKLRAALEVAGVHVKQKY